MKNAEYQLCVDLKTRILGIRQKDIQHKTVKHKLPKIAPLQKNLGVKYKIGIGTQNIIYSISVSKNWGQNM